MTNCTVIVFSAARSFTLVSFDTSAIGVVFSKVSSTSSAKTGETIPATVTTLNPNESNCFVNLFIIKTLLTNFIVLDLKYH